MRYFGTSFSLTLGAWRLRLRVDLEDALDADDGEKYAHVPASPRFADVSTSG